MNKQSAELTQVIKFFESISPDGLIQLDQIYDSQARFIDPFNDVSGIESIRAIFNDMFEQLDAPTFRIKSAFEAHNGEREAFVTWDFEFRFRSFRREKLQRIHGSSHLKLNTDGLIQYHRDYWDSAQLFQALPLIEHLMRWLKGRMSHSDSSQ